MSGLAPFLIVFVVACIVISVAVWLPIRNRKDSVQPSSKSASGRAEGRAMQGGDWVNAVVDAVAGLFLGVAIAELIQLMTMAFWPMAVLVPLLFAAVLFLSGVFDRLVDRLFPSGIRPARKPTSPGRTPLPRLLSLPLGLVVGVVLAELGEGKILLGWIS